MIVYNLRCAQGHEFEAWFRESAAYEAQRAARMLVCAVCETREVDKAPMAPALARGASAPAAPVPVVREAHGMPQEIRKMRQFMTGLRKYVEQNAEYVGPKFPEEARKIHYGETDERQIYGEATFEDVKKLLEEGVDVAPLPPDPDEAH